MFYLMGIKYLIHLQGCCRLGFCRFFGIQLFEHESIEYLMENEEKNNEKAVQKRKYPSSNIESVPIVQLDSLCVEKNEAELITDDDHDDKSRCCCFFRKMHKDTRFVFEIYC
jgi:hypothetical protein